MINADLAYGYRRNVALLPAATGILARIESLLVTAADAYRNRRYQDGIEAYQAARQLIWSQLSPVTPYDPARLRTVDITGPLTSYSAEWLNLLPVEQSAVGVRPRVAPEVDTGPTIGLYSTAVTQKTSQAAADLQVSAALAAVGSEKSANFFRDRAVKLDPNFVQEMEASRSEPGPGQPAKPVVGWLRKALPRWVATGPSVQPMVAEQPVHSALGATAPVIDVSRLALSPVGLRRADSSGFTVHRTDVLAETPTVTIPPALTAAERFYTVEVAGNLARLSWAEGATLETSSLLELVYAPRRKLAELPDALIAPRRHADVAIGLTHAWYYETALGLADCYRALGDYSRAESWYLAAAHYEFLNETIEAPYVWAHLAMCYLEWGNSLFRSGDAGAALPHYEKVLTSDGKAPAGAPLYSIPGLAPATAQAGDVIANLSHPDQIAATTSPAIQAVIFDVQSQLAKISGGLDFWGHWATNVPIWTFDYLQSVATTFTQLAIGAERDAISFWEKADAGTLTRTQLTERVAVSEAERDAAQRQAQTANAELAAYQAGVNTATLRAQDARQNANEYATKSSSWVMHQALSTQLSGGQDGDASELNQLADRMMQGGYSIKGKRGTLAAAESLTAARQQREYEVNSLKRQADELDAAAAQAKKERDAAAARVAAAQASANAAAVRVGAARQLLEAFDDQRFTPDVWNAMGEAMNHLAGRYLVMALDIAKRMQRAYNFENDTRVSLIKDDYTAESVYGMLAADSLLADVQSFTYELITSTAPGPQPVKQTLSLAQRYPFVFETQLRRTGSMQFQTTVADFDAMYPGTYAGRIVAVEVEVDGIVPPRGISGTLINTGISHYRVPSAVWVDGATELKHRVQNRESLVISDYDRRGDALVVASDRRRRGVFEGAGVASTWTLDLPPIANDLDYATITDVRLTFTYEARFDPDLKTRVLAQLEAAPSAHERLRPLPLRWLFPDAFFSFYSTGMLAVTLRRSDFGATENDPRLAGLGLIVVTTPRATAGGLVLRVGVPGQQPVKVTCTADGTIDAETLSTALENAGEGAAIGASALGAYTLEIAAEDNPSLVAAGGLQLEGIDNIALELGYSFTPGV